MSDPEAPLPERRGARPPEVQPPLPPVPAGVPDPSGAAWDLDLAAAGLRIETTDTDALFEQLGTKLARVLGPRAQLTREGGLLRSKRVTRIVVDTGAGRLEARRGRSGPEWLAVHAVRGITLQTSQITAAEWMDRLVGAVRDEASRSSEVRDALGRLLD